MRKRLFFHHLMTRNTHPAFTSVKRWAAPMCLLLGIVGVVFAVRVIAATVNSVPKYASGGSLIDSAITEVNGRVGIGTTSPNTPLHVASTGNGLCCAITLTASDYATTNRNGGYMVLNKNDGAGTPGIIQTGDDYSFVLTSLALNPYGGRVGIGTMTPASTLHVHGDVTVDGNSAAKYQDVAEWVPSHESLAAGTVVRASKDAGLVEASHQPYDTAVLGVVSSHPGVTLGEAAAGKVLVAQSGRVRVRVDASYGAIHAGDLLVSSPTRGVAMRSESVSVGGVELHRPGTLLGKALKTWTEGEGEILVLLTLQ